MGAVCVQGEDVLNTCCESDGMGCRCHMQACKMHPVA